MTKVFLDIVIADAPAGRIVLQLETKMCPKTSENFIQIAKGFTNANGKTVCYKDTIFHRIIPNFMIQFGDTDVKYTDADHSKAGYGGESIYGPTFPDENFHLDFDEKYLLAMANCGRNTNGSQVFITTKTPLYHLNNKHTVFGKVVEGKDVVDAIEAAGNKLVRIADCGVLDA